MGFSSVVFVFGIVIDQRRSEVGGILADFCLPSNSNSSS